MDISLQADPGIFKLPGYIDDEPQVPFD